MVLKPTNRDKGMDSPTGCICIDQYYSGDIWMISPKSRHHKERKHSHVRRKHSNKAFYNSKAWRDIRHAYLQQYQHTLFDHIARGEWQGESVSKKQQSYILSLGFLPCEICLRHYIAEAYDSVQPGKELDHIIPVNPDNALVPNMETKFGTISTCGDPYSFENLQFLCRTHHAKKSQRERK